MTTTSVRTQPVDVDEDGLPVWTYAAGAELVDGLRAWERLGVGHRCETWLAWSAESWSAVVVKLARPHQVDHPRAVRSLQREVDALQGLTHPNLPRLIVDGTGHTVPYVVLEYVDGPALDEVLGDLDDLGDDKVQAGGHLDDDSVALLGAQLLAALVPIHRRGLAHLDIKPENILVRDGRPVLADFGSARPIGSRQPAGHPVGTFGWAAPEMEACAPIAAAMDLYGVGRVLAACLNPDPGPEADSGHARRLRRLVADLVADAARERPTLERALDRVAGFLRAELRPWPVWVR